MDLPSYEVARRLTTDGMRVDKTRLSKFLNGREVPRHALAARLHQVLAEEEGTGVEPQEVALTRKLMYEAARVSGKRLTAREHEIAEAAERIEQERVRTAEALAVLNRELEAERRLRREAEEALEDLSSRTQEQIEVLQAQREAAQRRIDELQDQVTRTEALLRLQTSDAGMMARAAVETAAELARWEDSPSQPAVQNVIAQRFVDQVAQWRDDDEDQKAEEAIEHLCKAQPVTTARAVWNQFGSSQRWVDQQRVMIAVARLGDPLELFRSVQNEIAFPDEIRRYDWSGNLLVALAEHGPHSTVRRFHKAARERGKDRLLAALNRQLIKRQSRAGRRALIADDPAFGEDLKARRRTLAKARAENIAYGILRPFVMPILIYLDRRERRQQEKRAQEAQGAEHP
ncbi:hypothetical protein [Streptomyces sp. NPDC001410]|uniref:hypothetical protein n=1 Tax=Streptomyces sp. NPDC001410 TaxID=3364574 RepID=UPI003686B353